MIDVAFTRAGLRPATVVVVVDVLRAASTIAQALAAGYRRVTCCESVERARALHGPGRVLAGEQSCVRPEGFQLGNSPADFDPPLGEEVVLATTNGCPTLLDAAACADEVLVGCMLNLEALHTALDGRDVTVACSGTDGRPALEDVYAAGRIAAALTGPRTDAARIAEAVAAAYPEPRAALAASADAAVLRDVGLEADIAWCARESVIDVVPRICATEEGAAVVEGSPARSSVGPLGRHT